MLIKKQLSVGKRKIHNVILQLKDSVQKHPPRVLVEHVALKQTVEVKLERPLIVGLLKTLNVTLKEHVKKIAKPTLVENVLMMKPVVEQREK